MATKKAAKTASVVMQAIRGAESKDNGHRTLAAPAVPVALRIGKKGGRFTLSASGKKRYVK